VPARLLAALAVVLLGGLATATPAAAADLLDRKKLAKQVGAAVAANYPDLPVSRVRCPKKVKARPGVRAACAVTAGTYRLEMLVTVNDKKGNVTIASTQAVIPKASVEGLIAANATLPTTIDCGPDAYVVRRPGETFTCTAAFGDGSRQVVTLTTGDVAGNVTITTVAPAQ